MMNYNIDDGIMLLMETKISGWLTTDGNRIVDRSGRTVWITGCNWFGYNTGTNLVDGVWNRRLEDMIAEISERGINCLRLPFSSELLLNWKAGIYPEADYHKGINDDLCGMNSLEIFDLFVRLTRKYGMRIIIDIHSAETDIMGHIKPVWHTEKITTEQYLSSLAWISARYRDDDTIIAYDLKNEPHGAPGDKVRAIWNGSDDVNNWKKTAELAANTVLDNNPNALVLIEGIQIYPRDIAANDFTSTDVNDYHNTWWGANLMGVRDFPVDLGSEERNRQIVYSIHEYGPDVFMQPWFEGGFDQRRLYDENWHKFWLFIHEENIAPVFIGEWGGFLTGDNIRWMNCLTDLITEHQLNHTFWCFNPNSPDTGGLIGDDFRTWDEDKFKIFRNACCPRP